MLELGNGFHFVFAGEVTHLLKEFEYYWTNETSEEKGQIIQKKNLKK